MKTNKWGTICILLLLSFVSCKDKARETLEEIKITGGRLSNGNGYTGEKDDNKTNPVLYFQSGQVTCFDEKLKKEIESYEYLLVGKEEGGFILYGNKCENKLLNPVPRESLKDEKYDSEGNLIGFKYRNKDFNQSEAPASPPPSENPPSERGATPPGSIDEALERSIEESCQDGSIREVISESCSDEARAEQVQRMLEDCSRAAPGSPAALSCTEEAISLRIDQMCSELDVDQAIENVCGNYNTQSQTLYDGNQIDRQEFLDRTGVDGDQYDNMMQYFDVRQNQNSRQ